MPDFLKSFLKINRKSNKFAAFLGIGFALIILSLAYILNNNHGSNPGKQGNNTEIETTDNPDNIGKIEMTQSNGQIDNIPNDQEVGNKPEDTNAQKTIFGNDKVIKPLLEIKFQDDTPEEILEKVDKISTQEITDELKSVEF